MKIDLPENYTKLKSVLADLFLLPVPSHWSWSKSIKIVMSTFPSSHKMLIKESTKGSVTAEDKL